MKNRWLILVLFTLLFVVVISLALADGTETLGTPTITIETGNGMVAAGTGMVAQPGTIEVSVPTDVTIKQVLLYWEGKMDADLPGDDTILVNGTEVTGQQIGGQTFDFPDAYSSAFRADVTNLGLISNGVNTLTLEDLDFSLINDGAGVVVLYKGDDPDADIELFDGIDLAFQGWPEPERSTTEPQTFNFGTSDEERKAQLSMFIASVAAGGLERPSSIEVTTGGVTKTFSNISDSNSGDEWDTLNLDITIPKNADSLTVQVFSRDDLNTGNLPASLNWIFAGLMVPPDDGIYPGLEVSKICTADVFVGDEIEYEIAVENTGDEDLIDVVVDDSILGEVAEFDSLPVGELRTITETLIAAEAGEITNEVSASGTIASNLDPVESNTAKCTTDVHELEVTKDAQTSLVGRYNWEIIKTVDEKKIINLTLFPTQVYSPTYGVEVGLADPAYSESDWVVSGSISIKNPAPIDAPLKSVIDVIPDFSTYLPVIAKSGDSQNVVADQNQYVNSIPPGIFAPVDCPSLTVPAGETLVCTYGPVDLSSGLTRTNTAIAELKNRVGGEFSGTTLFSGTAQIDFSSAEIEWIDEEVTVTDNQKGILGTVNVANEPEFFPYLYPLPTFSFEDCQTRKQVINTATFTTNDTESKGNSSATVNMFCIASASTGFEDLPMNPIEGNDWDYNDALVEVSFNDPYPSFSPSNDLESITFQFLQPVNISANTHEFYIKPDVFECADDGDGATYTLTRNGVPAAVDEPYLNGQDLLILTDTGDPPNTAELVINFNVPSPGACPLDLSGFDPVGTFNGEGIFYVPTLVVKHPADKPEEWPDSWYTIEPISGPDPETRIVGVPTTWKWPKENQALWKVYPNTTPPDPNQGPPHFTPFWWLNYTGP